MKTIRVLSTGSCRNARIELAETGELVNGVERVEIVLDANTNQTKAILVIVRPILDIKAEAKIVPRGTAKEKKKC